MKPFDIKIGFGEKEVTLTILPDKEGYYKVVYFDGIVGAIRPETDGDGWEQVPEEEIRLGKLHRYEPDLNTDRLNFVLCEHTTDLIGEEILLILRD